MADRTLKVTLRANVAEFENNMRAASKSVREVYESSTDAEQRLQMQSQAMSELGQTSLVAGGVLAAGIGVAVASYADFDAAMSEVQASTHETADNMDALRDAAVAAGADTAFSASEAANAIDELAKAGVSTQDILSGGLTGSLDLAAAGGLGVARAAEIASITMSQFGLAGSDAAHIADVLSAGAGKALGSVDDLANGLKFVGPVAASMGISLEETTGVLALFAQQGIMGEQAGTSLRGVLSSLTSPSKEARAEIERLGLQLYDAQGNFLGLQNAAGQLSTAYTTMDGASRDASLGIIFGRETVTAATALYQAGAQGVDEWTRAVDDSGFAADQAQMRMDNLKGDLEGLAGSFETAMINLGEGADGPLRGFVQGLDDLVDGVGQMPPELQRMALGFSAFAAGTLIAGGGALTLIPKVAEARLSLATLGVTAAGTKAALASVFTNPATWGIAAAVAGMMVLEEKTRAAETSIADLATALENAGSAQSMLLAGGGAQETWLDTLGFDWDKQLADIDDLGAALEGLRTYNEAPWFTKLDPGEANRAEVLAQSLEGIGEALASMSAEDAARSFGMLREEYSLTADQMAIMLEQMPDYQNELAQQAAGLGLVDGAVDTYEERLALANFALEGGVTATEEHTSALAGQEGQADDTAGSIESLADELRDYNSVLYDSINAEIEYYEARRSASEEASEIQSEAIDVIDEMTGKLDLQTEAGASAMQQLMDVGQATRDYAADLYETTGSAEQMSGALQNGWNDVFLLGIQMGLSETQAASYANQLVGVPAEVKTAVLLEKAVAEAALGDYKALLDLVPSEIHTALVLTARDNTGGYSSTGLPSYATDGWTPPKYAEGGQVMGVDRGVDSVLAMLRPDEHVLTVDDVQRMGGHQGVYAFRAQLANPVHRNGGGAADGTLMQAVTSHSSTSTASYDNSRRTNINMTNNQSGIDQSAFVDAIIFELERRQRWARR